jgi:hypothetical protein
MNFSNGLDKLIEQIITADLGFKQKSQKRWSKSFLISFFEWPLIKLSICLLRKTKL